MICPKCGKENKDDAVFCGYCGTAMHNQEEPREEAKTSPESSDVKTFGLESSIPEEQSQGKDDNSVVNTANPSKPNKKPKKKDKYTLCTRCYVAMLRRNGISNYDEDKK